MADAPSKPKGSLDAALERLGRTIAARPSSRGYGPHGIETGREYLERLDRERLARLEAEGGASAVAEPEPAPVVSSAPMPADPEPEPDSPDAARAARRRGLVAAIARGEEPAGAPRPISAMLPPQVQAAARIRVNHWKVHKADVPERIDRETAAGDWFARIRAAAAGGHPGLSWHAIEKYAEKLIYVERRDRVGFVQRTGEQFAKLMGYCERHVTRLKNWFEAHGLFDVLNVLVRDADGLLVRGANIYVPTVDVPPAPLPADVEGADPVPSAAASRAFGGLARLAALFGLRERPWGLNATPISSSRLRRPAPA